MNESATNEVLKGPGKKLTRKAQSLDSPVDYLGLEHPLSLSGRCSQKLPTLDSSATSHTGAHTGAWYRPTRGAQNIEVGSEQGSDDDVQSIQHDKHVVDGVDSKEQKASKAPSKTSRSPMKAHVDDWASDISDDDMTMQHSPSITHTNANANHEMDEPGAHVSASDIDVSDPTQRDKKARRFESFYFREGDTRACNEPASPRQTAIVKPLFTRSKRVVKRDGYSQTNTAVDHRKRITQEKCLQAQLLQMIDQDIVDQVEAQGGITPKGRVFKAGIRMIERLMAERHGGVSGPEEPSEALDR